MSYGISFADETDTICHTGFDFPSVDSAVQTAQRVLREGFGAIPDDVRYDELGGAGLGGTPIGATVENEDDSFAQVWLQGGSLHVSYDNPRSAQ